MHQGETIVCNMIVQMRNCGEHQNIGDVDIFSRSDDNSQPRPAVARIHRHQGVGSHCMKIFIRMSKIMPVSHLLPKPKASMGVSWLPFVRKTCYFANQCWISTLFSFCSIAEIYPHAWFRQSLRGMEYTITKYDANNVKVPDPRLVATNKKIRSTVLLSILLCLIFHCASPSLMFPLRTQTIQILLSSSSTRKRLR